MINKKGEFINLYHDSVLFLFNSKHEEHAVKFALVIFVSCGDVDKIVTKHRVYRNCRKLSSNAQTEMILVTTVMRDILSLI